MSLKPNGKSQKTRNEAQYYEQIKKCLNLVMSKYLDNEIIHQSGLSEDMSKRIYFDIVGGKNVFSETLKREFDDDTLNIIRNEGIYPDLVGYVQKNSRSTKEIIIAEIKDEPITLKMIAKANFYREIFNASFAFLISTYGISEEKVRVLLKKPSIYQGVIIAKFVPSPQFNLGHLEINARFKESVPNFLHFWLHPKEIQPQAKPSFVNKIFKH